MTPYSNIHLKTVADKHILYVMAAEPEYGDHLRSRIQPLFTGIGPVEAATQLSAAMAYLASSSTDTRPDLILALGSAGSATLPQSAIFQASSISYRDMDASPLGFVKGQTPFLDLPIEVPIKTQISGLPAARLSTGANVISGLAYNAIDADMVDMESFSLLRVAQNFDVPFITLRGISDGAADLNKIEDWTHLLPVIDEKLAHAVDMLEASIANKTFEF